MMTDIQVLHGNCLDILPTLPDCSVDSIVTDPPYELGFMGKKWDASGIAYNADLWAECLRVLKPGGHLLAFGGTRTYHRMAVAIEDAGFEIRDSLHWIYGSGFPKSLDVSKAIDKTNGRKFEDRYALGRLIKECRIKSGFSQSQVNEWFGYKDGCQHWERQDLSGARVPTAADYALLKDRLSLGDEFDELVARIEAEREVIGKHPNPAGSKGNTFPLGQETDITAPATDAAKEWSGWGTALKPAHEPIVVARKPLVGTVAGNVLQFGTGAINIDGTRVAGDAAGGSWGGKTSKRGYEGGWDSQNKPNLEMNPAGRWPANIVFTHNHDCRQIGTRDDSYQINRLENWSGFGELKRPDYENEKQTTSVAVWECTEGCPVSELDQQSGISKSQGGRIGKKEHGTVAIGGAGTFSKGDPGFGDTGGASRFFTVTGWDAPFRYVAKPGKRERNAGLDALPKKQTGTYAQDEWSRQNMGNTPDVKREPVANHHPTVKPLALMRWLVRLVTPPNGTVLEPFAGSGTTLVACHLEGFNAIGIEMTDEYLPIIEGRLEWARQQPTEPEQLTLKDN